MPILTPPAVSLRTHRRRGRRRAGACCRRPSSRQLARRRARVARARRARSGRPGRSCRRSQRARPRNRARRGRPRVSRRARGAAARRGRSRSSGHTYPVKTPLSICVGAIPRSACASDRSWRASTGSASSSGTSRRSTPSPARDRSAARMRDAQADLAALDGGGGATTLRVGSTQDVAARVVPRVLAAFARVRTDVTVTLQSSETTDRVVGLVARGDVDLAFAELPLRNSALDGVPLYHDPFVVLVQATSALARRAKGVAPATVTRLPLIAHAPTRAEVEKGLRARGLEPSFVLESDAGAT